MDINDKREINETPKSNSVKIQAKLNKWKCNSSKVISTNKIDSFLKKEIEPSYNNQDDYIEEFKVNKVFNTPLKTCIQIAKDNDDNEEIIVELKQESVNDVETVTCVDNLNNSNIEFAEYFTDNSNNKVSKNQPCLESIAEKPNDVESYKIIPKSELNTNLSENLSLDSSKIETDMSIEIYNSIVPENRKCIIVETNLEQIKQRLKCLTSRISGKQKIRTRFYATIDSSENHQAESELSREISKDMFSKVSKSIITSIYMNIIF